MKAWIKKLAGWLLERAADEVNKPPKAKKSPARDVKKPGS